MTNLDTTSESSRRKTFAKNLLEYLTFGIKMYMNGTCDKPIKNGFMIADDCKIYGINKQQASEILGISVRQFDRYVKQGKILKGKKFRNKTTLFWNESYIRHIKTTDFM